jgi:hypothetical protein
MWESNGIDSFHVWCGPAAFSSPQVGVRGHLLEQDEGGGEKDDMDQDQRWVIFCESRWGDTVYQSRSVAEFAG